jgi:hypothetical protein
VRSIGKAQHLARPRTAAEGVGGEQLVDGDEVAERLRHLVALDLQEAVVEPVVGHHLGAEAAARLRHLVLVVRKDEIDAAAVDVEDLAEMLPRHRRALDMPARAPGRGDAGRRWPRRLARLRGLPQHEIEGRALVGRDVDAGARLHLVEGPLRQPAVLGHRGHAEQRVLLRHIGMAVRDEALDESRHLADVLGRARLDGRRQHAERGDVGVELRLGRGRHPSDRLVQAQGRGSRAPHAR